MRQTVWVAVFMAAVACAEATGTAELANQVRDGKLPKGSGSLSGVVYGGPPGWPNLLAIWDSSAFVPLAGAKVEVYWVGAYESDSVETPPPDTGQAPPDTGYVPPDTGHVPPPDTVQPPPSDSGASGDTLSLGRASRPTRASGWISTSLRSTADDGVRLLAGKATTDANGYFRIGELPAGRYELWVTPPSGSPYAGGKLHEFRQPDGVEGAVRVVLARE